MSRSPSRPRPLVTRAVPALGLAVVLGLGTVACELPDQLADADADAVVAALSGDVADLGASAPAPAPAPALAPAPAASGRDAGLWPFSSTSPWNTPIGSDAQLESASDPRTHTVRTYPTNAWLNVDQYSIPVYRATGSDPLVTLHDSSRGESWQVRMPASASVAAGTDANMAVIQPDGTTVDLWQASPISGTSMTARSVAFSHVTASGIGPRAGIRASGLSSLGGLIRSWEVDPADPNYTDGVIRHALAIAVDPGMLLHTGGGDGAGQGFVWPATSQDSASAYVYRGNLPMGSLLAIPKSVDLAGLGLDDQTMKIATAMQDYGGYVVDMAGSFSWYAEPTLAGSAFQGTVTGAPSWGEGLRTIRSLLVVVANNGPESVGGGGMPLAARAPDLG